MRIWAGFQRSTPTVIFTGTANREDCFPLGFRGYGLCRCIDTGSQLFSIILEAMAVSRARRKAMASRSGWRLSAPQRGSPITLSPGRNPHRLSMTSRSILSWGKRSGGWTLPASSCQRSVSRSLVTKPYRKGEKTPSLMHGPKRLGRMVSGQSAAATDETAKTASVTQPSCFSIQRIPMSKQRPTKFLDL